MDDGAGAAFGVLLMLILFTFGGCCAGHSVAKHALRESAKEAGVGEYYLDDEDNPQWRWKECK
jgi:hypothetical protein